MPTPYEQMRVRLLGHLRFAAIAWMIALPVMYLPLIWLKTAGILPDGNWLSIALFPLGCAVVMLGGMWVCVAVTLAGARHRGKAEGEANGAPDRGRT
jgi:hypothetical protein